MADAPGNRSLSAAQIAILAGLGEERSARAKPCTEWLDDEGSMAVQFAHEHLAAQPAAVA